MRIDEATFTIVDTETTGLRPVSSRLLEIGAISICGGAELDRFSELVNPGQAIPYRIARLTGITSDMVIGRPSVHDVLPRFLAFISGSILVGHNLRFDTSFLNAELGRCGLPLLNCQTLCTLRLARRLLRGLPSKGLGRLIQHFGISVEARHRALADAEATRDIFLRFLGQLADEFGITSVDALLKFQMRTHATLGRPARHIGRIRESVLPALPRRPGVYFMKGSRAEILYVGKAKDLSTRVRSYFSGIEGHPARTRQLLGQVRDITWTQTDSELAALILESRLIKEHQPRFNRADRRYHNRPFLRLGQIGKGTWLTVITHIRHDGAEYYGPLASRGQAEQTAKALVTLFGPDHDLEQPERIFRQRPSRFGGKLSPEGTEPVGAFFQGESRGVLGEIDARMRSAAAALEFEKAARWRNALRHMEEVSNRGGVVAISVFDRNMAVICPLEEGALVHLVRFGLCVQTIVVQIPVQPAAVRSICASVAARYGSLDDVPHRFSRPEADEIRVLAHWMYQERDRVQVVHLRDSIEEFKRSILECIGARSLQ